MKEYKFDSVQVFYKELNVVKREYLDYKTACADQEKTYGEKWESSMSFKDRIQFKKQIVKEREVGRDYRIRQKDKGARWQRADKVYLSFFWLTITFQENKNSRINA